MTLKQSEIRGRALLRKIAEVDKLLRSFKNECVNMCHDEASDKLGIAQSYNIDTSCAVSHAMNYIK